MKLMGRNRDSRYKGWSVAFTLVFAVQLLASTLCLVSSAQAAEEIMASHCHETMKMDSGHHMSMQHEMGAKPAHAQPEDMQMSTCSHCESPEDVALFVNDLDLSEQLSAFIVVEASTTFPATASRNFMERAQAPPRSSTTLYTTTQRIRI